MKRGANTFDSSIFLPLFKGIYFVCLELLLFGNKESNVINEWKVLTLFKLKSTFGASQKMLLRDVKGNKNKSKYLKRRITSKEWSTECGHWKHINNIYLLLLCAIVCSVMQLQQAFSVVMICDKQSMEIICTARMSAKVVVKAVGGSWKYRENIPPPPGL